MRTAIVIGVISILIALSLLLYPEGDPASLVFQGYHRYENPLWTNDNGRAQATFVLTNHTGHWLHTSQASGLVEVKSANGWTNYPPNPREVPRIDLSPIPPHGVASFTRDFPGESATWRFHVTYGVPPTKLGNLLGLKEDKKDLWSAGISNEPAVAFP